MTNPENKKLLLPKTALGKASVIYFCFVWWLLNNYPIMHFFDNMVSGEKIVWLFGMPINFTYIILVALLTVVWSFVIFKRWDVEGEE